MYLSACRCFIELKIYPPNSPLAPDEQPPLPAPYVPPENPEGDELVQIPPVEEALGLAAPKPDDEIPEWSLYDLNRSMRLLRSTDLAHVQRAITALHVKWWHCSAHRMRSLLATAGLPEDVLKHIKPVIDACRICRQWQRPGDKSIASSIVVQKLGECIQIDLLFVLEYIVLHILDEATRFSVCRCIPDKTAESILEGLSESWIAVFGGVAGWN